MNRDLGESSYDFKFQIISSLKNLNINITHHRGIQYLHLKNSKTEITRVTGDDNSAWKEEQIVVSVEVTDRQTLTECLSTMERSGLLYEVTPLGTSVCSPPPLLSLPRPHSKFQCQKQPCRLGCSFAGRDGRAASMKQACWRPPRRACSHTGYCYDLDEANRACGDQGSALRVLQFLKKQVCAVAPYPKVSLLNAN